MAKSVWVENLRREIESVPVPTQSIPAPIKPTSNQNVLGLACLIVCTIVLGIALALWQHSGRLVAVEYPQAGPVAIEPQTQSPPVVSDQPDLTAVKNTVNSLVEREKELQHKVWMLGVLNNNNFAAVQQICPNSDLGLVYVQSNWSVDRIPTRIQLTDAQKQSLGNVPTDSR